jgi:hypothetical protein
MREGKGEGRAALISGYDLSTETVVSISRRSCLRYRGKHVSIPTRRQESRPDL